MTIDDYYDPRFLAVIYTATNAKPQLPLSKHLLYLSSTASGRNIEVAGGTLTIVHFHSLTANSQIHTIDTG